MGGSSHSTGKCIKTAQMYLERLPPLKHQIDRQLSDDDDGDGLEVDDMIVVVMLPLLRSCDFVCWATTHLLSLSPQGADSIGV